MNATDIITQSAAAAMFAKVLVDVLKTSPIPSPAAILPIAAFLFGEGAAFLLLIAGNGQLDRASIAQTVLVGILAGGSAIGVTALSRKGDATQAEEK